MYWIQTFCQNNELTINKEKTWWQCMQYNQDTTPRSHIRDNQYKWCKASDILVWMFHWQIHRIYVMHLHFKWVGIVIVCLRMNATEVILKYGRWGWWYSMSWWSKCSLYRVEVLDDTTSHGAQYKIEKIQKSSYIENLESNPPHLTLSWYQKEAHKSIEVLTMQRVWKYILKVKNMYDHILPKQAWKMGCEI